MIAAHNNKLDLVALCDLDPLKMNVLLEASAFAGTAPSFYTDHTVMLREVKPQLVAIATDSGVHARIALDCIRAGCHVIIEKPIAMSIDDARQIAAEAEKYHVKVAACHQNRFNEACQQMHLAREQGRFGKLSHGSIHVRWNRNQNYYDQASWRGKWASDGGALMNQGIHGVDILRYLMGPVKNVQSVVRTLLHDIEVEDSAVAALEFECGAIGVITASTASNPGYDREINIYGSRGGIEFKQGTMVRLVIDGEEYPCGEFRSVGDASSNLVLDYRGHARQLTAFVRAINGENVSYPDQYAGKQAVELIETIYKSSI
jgi:predicted dehydrogenase